MIRMSRCWPHPDNGCQPADQDAEWLTRPWPEYQQTWPDPYLDASRLIGMLSGWPDPDPNASILTGPDWTWPECQQAWYGNLDFSNIVLANAKTSNDYEQSMRNLQQCLSSAMFWQPIPSSSFYNLPSGPPTSLCQLPTASEPHSPSLFTTLSSIAK